MPIEVSLRALVWHSMELHNFHRPGLARFSTLFRFMSHLVHSTKHATSLPLSSLGQVLSRILMSADTPTYTNDKETERKGERERERETERKTDKLQRWRCSGYGVVNTKMQIERDRERQRERDTKGESEIALNGNISKIARYQTER